MKSTKIDTATLTPAQAQVRMNVRNFLLVATPEELKIELRISLDAGDSFRARCVEELIGAVEPPTICEIRRRWKELHAAGNHALKEHSWWSNEVRRTRDELFAFEREHRDSGGIPHGNVFD